MSASSAEELVGAIRSALAGVGDPTRAVHQQRYMKSALPFRGISSPELRALLRPVLAAHTVTDRADLDHAVRMLWDGATHREEWYAALAVLRHRAHREWVDLAMLGLVRHLVVTGAWWDVVDEIAQHLVGAILAGDREGVAPLIREWAVDDELWVRRTAILAQNRHRDRADPDLLADVLDANLLDSPHGREFFIRKAVGWALREHAKTSQQWVLDYCSSRSARLSPLSRKEALKHMA